MLAVRASGPYHPKTVPIVHMGPVCARRGCRYPEWKDGLCNRCWRLAHMFAKDPELFAFEPLHGYADVRDAVEWPWEEQEALERGVALADLVNQASRPDGSEPGRRAS